jgi:hypothetical protein
MRPHDPDTPSSHRTAAPPTAQRTFRAADGAPVTAREVDAPREPWVRGPRCLLFEREGAIRRVWDYPAGWADLPDAALDALSWRR